MTISPTPFTDTWRPHVPCWLGRMSGLQNEREILEKNPYVKTYYDITHAIKSKKPCNEIELIRAFKSKEIFP